MKLKLFKILEGGLYSGENPLEVDFTKSKKVGLTGDSGSGKTTGLELFKLVLGGVASEQVLKDLVNKFSGRLDVEQTFTGKDRKNYVVKLTKSQFYVREEGSTNDVPQPKSFIEENLGTVAADPMRYKNADVEKLIKWLAGFSDLGEEGFEKEYKKQKEAVKEGESGRAAANKEAKARRTMLADAGYMNDSGDLIEAKWTAAEKKYSKKLDVKALSGKLDEAGKKSDNLLKAETKLKELKTREQQLLAELADVQAAVAKGEKYIDENKGAKKEYDEIKSQYDTAASFAAEYEAFQTSRRQLTEMYEYEQVAQRADAAVQAAEKKKKEILWNVIPDARGIEIELEDTPTRKAGFYVNGFNSRQLAATEYLVAVVKILRKLGCKILVLDDLATYGTDFLKQLDQLANDGWFILTAEMRRNQELTIEY